MNSLIFKKSFTLVMGYCMNLEIPYFGEEQLFDAYYYSPIWLYILGIGYKVMNKIT